MGSTISVCNSDRSVVISVQRNLAQRQWRRVSSLLEVVCIQHIISSLSGWGGGSMVNGVWSRHLQRIHINNLEHKPAKRQTKQHWQEHKRLGGGEI